MEQNVGKHYPVLPHTQYSKGSFRRGLYYTSLPNAQSGNYVNFMSFFFA